MDLFFWKKKEAPPQQAGSITVSRDASGLLVLTVSGVISPAAIASAQEKILAMASKDQLLRALVDAVDFQGWVRGFNGGMEESEKMFSIDDISDRIAVIADPEWHKKLKLFLCVWMRKGQMQFFNPAQRSTAMLWLQAKNS